MIKQITEEQTEQIINKLIERIEQANTTFLKSIGSSIKEIKKLKPSEAQKLIQILKYGGNYEDIIREISKYTDLNIEDIDEIFKQYAIKDQQFYQQFYDYRDKPFISFEENLILQRQTQALANMVKNEMYNFTRSNVLGYKVDGKFMGLRDTYNKMLDTAFMNVGQGKETFDNAMSKILKQVGTSGIKTIEYESGRSMRLDSAVRMHLKSRLRELHNENQKIIGDEIGADGYEISVHSNPAIDHEKVQGRQFSIEEYTKLNNGEQAKDYKGRYYTLDHDGKNGYRPISEMNCYHYIFSIVLGASEPEYSDEQLQEIIDNNEEGFEFEGKHYTNYEGTQMQRSIERAIREQKDIQILAKASGNDLLIGQSQEKIRILNNKYKKLNKASGLSKKADRLRVSGYRRQGIKNIKSSEQKTINNFKDNDLINFVDIKELDKYKTHSKEGKYSNKTIQEYNELKQDIIKNGIQKGGNLLYDETDGYTIINEGNNRLAIAQELGYEKFPIYVTKTDKNISYRYDDRGVYLEKRLAKGKGKYIKYKDLKNK